MRTPIARTPSEVTPVFATKITTVTEPTVKVRNRERAFVSGKTWRGKRPHHTECYHCRRKRFKIYSYRLQDDFLIVFFHCVSDHTFSPVCVQQTVTSATVQSTTATRMLFASTLRAVSIARVYKDTRVTEETAQVSNHVGRWRQDILVFKNRPSVDTN